MNSLIGREEEKKVLQKMLSSKEAELLALYGRRRTGKTFLIEQFLKRRVFSSSSQEF